MEIFSVKYYFPCGLWLARYRVRRLSAALCLFHATGDLKSLESQWRDYVRGNHELLNEQVFGQDEWEP